MIPSCKKIFLCRPDRVLLTVLNGVQTNTVDFHPQIKGYSELSFVVDRYINVNGELVESNGYGLIKTYMYLYLEDIGYFIIEPPEITNDGNHEEMSITAYSAEKEFENRDWVGIKINCGTPDSMEYSNTDESNKDSTKAKFAIEYVSLLNEEDINLSFLHQILKKMSTKWNIQYVSPILRASTRNNKARLPALDIDSENLYAVMTSEVGPRMSCLFIFDYLNFGIRVYYKDEFELDTGIFINFRNLENNLTVSVDHDSVYTRFSVEGDDGLVFRDYNYGDNTIINLDYFLGDPYMDLEMANKYVHWKTMRDTYREDYKELAFEYNCLMEKRDELIYRVPSDASYWKNWTSVNEEGLLENLKYYNMLLQTLQEMVDPRDESSIYITIGDKKVYKSKQTGNNSQVNDLLNRAQTKIFGNVNLTSRQVLIWTQALLQKYSTADYDYISTNFAVGNTSTVLCSWRAYNYSNSYDKPVQLSIAYSRILETTNGPIIMTKTQITNYLNALISNATNSSGVVNLNQILTLDRNGISGQASEGYAIKNIVAYVSSDYTEIETDNAASIASQIINGYEDNDTDAVVQALHSYQHVSADHQWYEDLLYENMDIYSGYYTYCEIVEYILPYIKMALDNVGKIVTEKKEPVSFINENWDLYGLEELKGVKAGYEDEMTALVRFSKPWSELTQEDIDEYSLNYFNEESYENHDGRLKYKHYKEQIGDDYTPGTICYKIKELEQRIASIEQDMAFINKKTNDYTNLMKYNLSEEDLYQIKNISSSLVNERATCLFDTEELIIFDSLLKDTDYVNSNILVTSIMSTSEKFDVEKDLLDDAEDKLVEVSQPQFKFSVSMDNFFRLADYSGWADEFAPGGVNSIHLGMLKFIRVTIRDDYYIKLRVIGYRWNPCEITPDLTFEFSNMITSRSGRSDLTELLEQENYRGGKNSIRIGNGTASGEQEYIEALMDLLRQNSIFTRAVENIASGATGQLDETAVQNLIDDYLNSRNIDANSIDVAKVQGLDGDYVIGLIIDSSPEQQVRLLSEIGIGDDVVNFLSSYSLSNPLSLAHITGIDATYDDFIANNKISFKNGSTELTSDAISTTTATIDQGNIASIESTSLTSDEANIDEFTATEGEITTLTSTTGYIAAINSNTINSINTNSNMATIGDLIVDYGDFTFLNAEDLKSNSANITYLDTTQLNAKNANIDVINAKKGNIAELTSDIIQAEYIKNDTIDSIHVNGDYGDFIYLDSELGVFKKIVVDEIDGSTGIWEKIVTDVLEAKDATIKKLVSELVFAEVAEIDLAHIGQATIEQSFIDKLTAITATSITDSVVSSNIINLVADNVSVADLQAGDITLSNKMRIKSENGALLMDGSSLQLFSLDESGDPYGSIVMGYSDTTQNPFIQIKGKDGEGNDYVGVQLGYDTSSNPSLIVRNSSNQTILTPEGITENAIADGLIVNDMVQVGTLDLDRLSESVATSEDLDNRINNLTIENIYWGGEKFGVRWTTFSTELDNRLNNLAEASASVELSGPQVFVDSDGVITPDSITLIAEEKNGAIIKEWYIDNVVNTTYVASDKKSITIPSSAIKNKKTMVIKVQCTRSNIYDVMSIYRLEDGNSAYTVTITSSNGSVFNQEGNTVCTCRVFYGTDEIIPKSYEWIAKIDNSTTWTTLGTSKDLTLPVSSSYLKRLLKCRVTI